MSNAKQSSLMVGISGLRGMLGGASGTNKDKGLTPAVVSRFAAAVGQWMMEKAVDRSDDNRRIILGRDSRPSGPMLEQAATAGLLSVGCEVVRLGLVSTPGAGVMIGELDAVGGVMITASHNPLPWNGLKAIRADSAAPPPAEARQIIEKFETDQIDYVDVHHLGVAWDDSSAAATHVDKVAALIDVDAVREVKLTAVVDSVNGAGGPEALLLLDRLGVKTTWLNDEPTGWFAHTPEPTRENLTELCEVVAQAGADVGFAQDPDADRLAIVDEQGTYIGEEYTLVLGALSSTNGLAQGEVVAANLSTSRMIDDLARSRGGRVIRTPVGEANVSEAMRTHDLRLGGEGNGGVIDRRVSQIRDSLIAMALTLETLAHHRQPLSEIHGQLPRYAMVKQKQPIEGVSFDEVSQRLAEHFADQYVDTQDGIRIDWDDRWVHLRPSNTEPIVRLIAEAKREDEALSLIDAVRQAARLGR